MSCASRAVSAPALGARRAVARAPRAAGSRLAARRRGAVARASEAPADADVVRAPRPEYIPSRIDDENYVRVFDTTLRDGEQSPGATRARAIRSSPPAPNPLRTSAPPRRKRRPESIPLSRPLAATAATDRRPATDRIHHLARPRAARLVPPRAEGRSARPPPPLAPLAHPPPPPPFSTRPRSTTSRESRLRRDVDLEGEARHRAQPGEARGGRHRGRFPDREPRRPGRGSQHRQVRRQRAVRRRLRPRDLRVIPREQEGHRRELGGRPARPPPPHPHLHRHEQDPHGGQAPQDPRRGGADRRGRGDVREVARVRRRRVLPRGRRAIGPRVSASH